MLPESTYRLFEGPYDVTMVTVDPDGSPQASLVWAERDGDQLLVGMEGFRKKARNLRRDPRVTLVVVDDRPSAHGLTQYLVIRGRAELEGPGIPERFRDLMDHQSKRYLGKDVFPFPNRESDRAVIARITVDRVTGEGPWAA